MQMAQVCKFKKLEQRPQLGDHPLRCLFMPGNDQDLRALLREDAGNALADARAATGYDDALFLDGGEHLIAFLAVAADTIGWNCRLYSR